MWFAGIRASQFILIESLLTGLLSIILFERFAQRLVEPDTARLATAVFAFWPVSCFYDMGYPVGLISICIIAALSDHLAGRDWRAAIWLGLGSGIAPTVVFVGFAIGVVLLLRWEQRRDKLRGLLPLILWSLIALGGLIGFVVYQAVRFHDPFAFLSAQDAWGKAPNTHMRFLRLADPGRYLQQPRAGLNEIKQGYHLITAGSLRNGMSIMEGGLQRLLNFSMFLFITASLFWATRILPRRAIVVVGAGWAVFFGYLWTIVSTDQNLLTVPRLLFPAIALCIGLGGLSQRFPRVARYSLIGFLVIVIFAETAFAAAGFWVT